MRVVCLYRVEPAGYFGVPDGQKVVLPANAAGVDVLSPTLDTRSGLLVNHGTLSSFRSDDAAVREEVVLEDARLRFNDEFLTVMVEADSLLAGANAARVHVTRFLRHLMVAQPDYFRATLMQYEGDSEPVQIAQPPVRLMNCTLYNLDELRQRIRLAARRSLTEDTRLMRALVYYEHARFLLSIRTDLSPPMSAHGRYLLASAFLHFWKAITVVLGDPGTDRDYQRRFRKIGLPANYWKATVEPLKNVRDDADVAHYQLDDEAIGRVEATIPMADSVCRQVLERYSEHLNTGPVAA